MTIPRRSQLELNFDGLTDSVTNLVGALILLIVLLIAVTQQAVVAPPSGTIPETSGTNQSEESEASLTQLLRQMAMLRAQTTQFRNRCSSIEAEVLDFKVSAAQILKAPKESDE